MGKASGLQAAKFLGESKVMGGFLHGEAPPHPAVVQGSTMYILHIKTYNNVNKGVTSPHLCCILLASSRVCPP